MIDILATRHAWSRSRCPLAVAQKANWVSLPNGQTHSSTSLHKETHSGRHRVMFETKRALSTSQRITGVHKEVCKGKGTIENNNSPSSEEMRNLTAYALPGSHFGHPKCFPLKWPQGLLKSPVVLRLPFAPQHGSAQKGGHGTSIIIRAALGSGPVLLGSFRLADKWLTLLSRWIQLGTTSRPK